MKLPEFILDYARKHCNIHASNKEIFKLIKMIFENRFDENEIESLLEYIRKKEKEGWLNELV
ncbi:hypothetical protein LCGC14_1972900 [marine sediment metagenome]|uniref:Uncharacterized protein n=1 Tax=marine sediment metagenome TaxID=412755 RepID=A0A0F9EPA2_9ZZZZ